MNDRELMQLALNSLITAELDGNCEYGATDLLRARLAQPEPEPVAWLFQNEETGLTECVDTQQVEWGFEKSNPRWQKIAPLYTVPPQREFIGLTEGELFTLWVRCPAETEDRFAFARAIEQVLKEKNNG